MTKIDQDLLVAHTLVTLTTEMVERDTLEALACEHELEQAIHKMRRAQKRLAGHVALAELACKDLERLRASNAHFYSVENACSVQQLLRGSDH